jgi:hypothetical protein
VVIDFPRSVEYREGDRRLSFYMETTGIVGPTAFTLFDDLGSSSWLPPHSEEPLTLGYRREILIRVTAALAFLGATPGWSSKSIDENAKWRDIYQEALARVAEALGTLSKGAG